nr:Uridylate kinase [Ipomoea batatas]GMD44478.1 Uridylate kinase [Ipomoea batatas]
MASCDDDFPLLAFSSHRFKASQIHAPPIHGGSPKDISGEDDVVSPEGEGYSDGGAFCSQPDPKDSNSSSYHVVGMNPYENDSNPYETEPDPSRSRASAGNGKRAEQDDISENGTPYSYKKSKLNSSVASSGGGGSGEYRKDREEWSDTAIACLLEAYTEKFMQLNRGNLRGRDWEEVAAMVSDRCEKQTKSVEQCKNKVDNLKKRYKLERHRMSNGGISASHWPWYKQMEQIVGNSLLAKAVVEEEKSGNLARPAKRFGTPIAGPGGQINNMKLKSSGGPRWRRVVFKISGAALAGTTQNNIDPKVAMLIAREISIACRVGVEVAVVVGGRNFFCGDSWVTSTGLDRCTAYQIGMMATLMNSMLLQSALEKLGVQTRLQSAFSMPEVAEPYNRQRAIRHLEKGRVVIFGGIGAGTGISLFTTDTAAALRASEIHADAMLKGTNVEGVYVCDSRSNNLAAEHISYRDLASKGAAPIDMMAVNCCEENGIPVVIFNLHDHGNISRALTGEPVGTLIDQTGRVS